MRTPDELWYLVYRKYEKQIKDHHSGLCTIVSSLYYTWVINKEEVDYLRNVIYGDIPEREVYLFPIKDVKSRKKYIKSKMNARTKRELWFPQGVYNKICLYWDVFTFSAFLMLVLLGVMWLFATIVNWMV